MKMMLCLKGSAEALPIIQKVKDMGLRAVVVDPDPKCVSRSTADEFICADHYNAEETLRAVIESGIKPDAVLSCAGDTPHTAAAMAEHFGLPGLTREQARLSVDKFYQKNKLKISGVPVPDSVGVTRLDMGDFGDGAYVCKPRDSRGGRGVIRLLGNTDPFWAFDVAKSNSPSGKVVVEQWLDGPQLSTESIVQDGKVLFTAVGLRNYSRLEEFAPFCIEDGFESPPYVIGTPGHCGVDEPVYFDEHVENIDGGVDRLPRVIDELIERACKALEWYQVEGGTVKGDLVVERNQNGPCNVYIIELAGRLSGGFFATHGHPLAYGVDFVGAAVKLAMGERIESVEERHGKYVSQRYMFPADCDIGKRVSQFNPPYTFGDDCSWNIRVGDTIHPVTHHGNRLDQVICTGQTADEARERAETTVVEMKKGVVLE